MLGGAGTGVTGDVARFEERAAGVVVGCWLCVVGLDLWLMADDSVQDRSDQRGKTVRERRSVRKSRVWLVLVKI